MNRKPDFSITGIDISSDTLILNWDSVWKVSIQYLMCRSSVGMEVDKKFDEHMRESENGCVRTGVYHVLRATSLKESAAESKFLIKTIRPYQYKINFFVGIWLDEQSYRDNFDLNTYVTLMAKSLIDAGYIPIICADVAMARDLNKYRLPIWLRTTPGKNIYEKDMRNVVMVQEDPESVMGYNNIKCGKNTIANWELFHKYANKFKVKDEDTKYTSLFNKNPIPLGKRELKKLTEAGEWAIKEGIIFPSEDGTYQLDKKVTREEFFIMLNRMYGLWRLYDGHGGNI